MKKVVIFGAAGSTGKYIVRKLQSVEDVRVSAFVRNPAKFEGMDISGVTIIQGDALNAFDVKRAVKEQDILVCSLEGDVRCMAQNIAAALPESSVKKIIWITGMGIHQEITGFRGKMLNIYAKKRPDYIEAADIIAGCDTMTTLLRCPGIQDGENEAYYLTKEGEQPRRKNIHRSGIAKCLADMIADDSIGLNESLGITN